MSNLKTILLFCILSLPAVLKAQRETDTLALARQHAFNKDFQKADHLLSQYQRGNPDQYTLQLHAQVLYWMKDFTRARETYRKAISRYPAYQDVVLDYARFLFQTGKWKEAEELLQDIVSKNKAHPEANINLAYIALWKGDIKEARIRTARLHKLYPGNASVQALRSSVNDNSSFVKTGYTYASDDQPLQTNVYNLDAAFFSSPYFQPYVSAAINRYTLPSPPLGTIWVRAGNNVTLAHGATQLGAEGGIFKSGADFTSFTGSLFLVQKISTATKLHLGAAKSPYQYTNASIDEPFTYNIYKGAIEWNAGEKKAGRIGTELARFRDGNTISTVYAWILLPLIEQKFISLKAGYGISFAHAVFNTYSTNRSVDEIASSQPLNSKVDGVYDPYFTPSNQLVNSLLGSAKINISKSVSVHAKGNLGVWAAADNPELRLERKGFSGYTISKTYYRQKYTPIELEAGLQAAFSDRLSMQANLRFNRLFFYARTQAGIHLNYRFIHEKSN